MVAEQHRRKGLGSSMLKAYLKQIQGYRYGSTHSPGAGACTEVRLICKQHLQGFYQSACFDLVGQSSVVHGQDPWFEMVHRLEAA